MGLRFDPVGGGSFKAAVQQIIESESRPLKALEARKAKEDSRLKLFQDFKTKFGALDKLVSEISNFHKFRELKADLGDGANLMSVTVDKDRAEPGEYLIEIDELALRTSVLTNNFSSATDNIMGSGYVSFELPSGDNFDIYVEDSESSLRGIANAINRNPKSPVTASVIKDTSDSDAPYRLLLAGKKDGEANQINIPGFYFYEGEDDLIVYDDYEAKNAVIQIDNFEIETESNDINDFLPGVNVHLKQADSSKPFNLKISEDYQKISAKMKGLVDGINQVLQFIIKQNQIDQKSDTSTTFAGDSTLQSLEYRIRNLIHTPFSGTDNPDIDPRDAPKVNLSEIGIEFDKTGLLSFKEDKFNKIVESNFSEVATAITAPDGFASEMQDLINGFGKSSTGLLNTKEQAIRTRIKEIDRQIEDKTRVIERRKEEVVRRFSNLESTIGNLQKQQQFLSAALPGSQGGGSLSQLLGA